MKILPNGRYELCLPFKSEAIDLSSNKDLAWKRLKKMCERAQRNGVLDNYKVVFKEWEELEIIEKIEEKGPNLIEQIPDILDRFRRFFYPDEGEEIVFRHCRVVFGVSSSPFLLAAVLAGKCARRDDTQLGSKLKLSFDVDNCVTGVNSIAQQQEFILRSKEILSRGCFNLRNWESNVESKHISKSTDTTKLLGIIWDLDKDTLKCKIDFESLSDETKITKRLILATIQKFFDPIGMLCFVTLTPKILLPWYARNFTKFHSILRLVAWVLRFLNNVRSRISDKKKGQLSLDELESAEIQLIRSVQAQSFTDEKLISNLSVFRDDNIIRVKTRITERIDAPNFLSPILLPNNYLAGPLYVKRGDKVWIVLYTSAIYRALHLELVSSLSTDAFLLSFRRFVARRGRPRLIYSNNGTNFRGAYNELIVTDWNEVYLYAEIQRTTWKFIPSTAAWWGGFWERLVRTMKELFRRTLRKAIFTYEELLTILCECEKVVSSRPLTYLSEDTQDLTPITPARFLFEIPTADTKDLDFRDANHFRKRLRFRAKSSNIQVGDIVLIRDDWKKRIQWSLARVIKLIPGKDRLVGTVKLKTQSCTLTRPIQRVFPLEVSGNEIANPPLQKVQ
ncbi:integrase catalytic domain-containing protein [Trichonephila clavipes]|nr:integrase catalytic domain-containing protein [Trichonephila clavipes]